MTAGRIVEGKHVGGRLIPRKPHGLRLEHFGVNLSAFPPTPQSTHYASLPAAQPVLTDILGNDRYGCCTEANQFHLQALRQAAAGRTVYHPPVSVVLDIYARDGGEPGDNGCDETVVMTNAQTLGIPSDDSGCLDTIAGFVLVDATSRDLVRAVVTTFVGASICIGLPDAWVAAMPSSSGFTWGVDGEPNADNGHCFSLYDQGDAILGIGSWGMFGSLTYEALAEYAVESAGGALYIVLDDELLGAAQATAPDGLDWAALRTAFAAVGGA